VDERWDQLEKALTDALRRTDNLKPAIVDPYNRMRLAGDLIAQARNELEEQGVTNEKLGMALGVMGYGIRAEPPA
jgi:hypothetical protein